MSVNNPPSGQDPDRTTAYNWNQGQQPANPPTTPMSSGEPYPPQQPYGQQAQGGYGQQPPQQEWQQQAYGQQPSYGQQPQQQQQWQQGGWQQQQPQQGWQQEQGWQQQNQHAQGGWQQQGPEGFGPAEPAKKGPKGWIIAVAAALAVVLLGGGAVWAVGAIGGGGTQPHEVLPADSIAYARLDLDPAANQKMALFQLARKFTVTKDTFSGEDPRKALFDTITKDDDSKVDFAKDVDPWLGSRIGFAAVPSGKEEPDFAVAVQITDEEQAKAGIAKLMEGDKYGIAFREDYALLTPTQELADKYAQAEGSLGDNTAFNDDMATVGEQGVLSFWTHVGGIAQAAKKELTAEQAATLDQIKDTRFAGALRFDSAYVELAGIVSGAKGMVPEGELPPANLGSLPATTAGALSVSGLDQVVTKNWANIEKQATATGAAEVQQMLAQVKTRFGLELPGDLATLFGKNFTFAVDSEGLDTNQFKGGVRIATDPAKAQAILDKIQQAMASGGQGAPQLAKVAGDGVFTVATTDDYAKKLAETGTLGDSETFQTAIANPDEANAALFVDLDKIENLYLNSLQGDDKANAQVLRAVGMSTSITDSSATFSLRVLFN
ncbi:hypothetical protein E1294_22330 [Nonomuraea diastatica]|uniref:DUF3352 domain-containing protein n=2 Tax=Nonomuraea diastatica TaxID=1848329 RepID=A0A4R4WJ04_9ACTN|nr:hypothetical protein E1294_22330 [Nonomuraea diastatica]